MPFSLDLIREQHDQQWKDDRGHVDDRAVFQALRDVDALGDQQSRRPGDKSVEAYRLEEIEQYQHDRALDVARAEDFPDAAFARILVVRHFRLGQWSFVVGGDTGLDRRHHPLGFFHAALLGQPAGTLRQAETDPPNDDGADGADPDNPAPSVIAEDGGWGQLPGQEIGYQEGDRAHRLEKTERRAAGLFGNEFGKISVDRDQLQANAQCADEPPDVDAIGGGLQAHDEVGDAEPQQRVSENSTPAETIGDV